MPEAICPYCGVGCRVLVETDANRIVKLRGADAAANRGRLCPKGGYLPKVIDTEDRLGYPQVRAPGEATFRRVGWDEAIGRVAGELGRIVREHGPDAVAFYGSGQLDTEAWYLAGKLFKGGLGTNNTDSNSRLCMASAVAGYRTSLGSDGPPTCYEDVDHADVILIAGANPADAHPVLFDRIKAAKRARPELRIIVLDPRRTKTADLADVHVPLRPGSDIAFFNAVGHALLLAGRADRAFIDASTEGFAEYAALLCGLDPAQAADLCGVPAALIEQVAGMLGGARRLLSLYCMGENQSTVGMWKNNTLINLHLLLGQIGRPGAGPFSLTGQPNAMGGREAGALAHMLPGYRLVEDDVHREAVERFWGVPAGRIAPRMGLTAVEIFRELERGRLKAVWIAATNPMVSLPDLNGVRRALERAELVVVQDCYHPTDTTRYAHVLLPAAQFGEKEGTSTNSERMVAHSERFLDPPGEALPDWEILARVARGLHLPGFEFRDAAAVWDEYRLLTAGTPCDQAGISATRLRRERELQWPCPSEDHPGTARRYLDRRFPTPSGRARFLPRCHRDPVEQPDHEFPLVLTTGRLAAHWHTLTRTGKVPQLVNQEPEPFIEMHPDDAEARGIAGGDLVLVASRRGSVRVTARVTDRLSPGVTFMPFHWGDLGRPNAAANYLTLSAIGRVAKQPEYKHCAVTVEPLVRR